MALKAPNLDDRKFQDIVSEARSKIPTYCPRWTDYNLSDPGITLIELFAWMVDLMLYRLNRVPEKNYIKFMDLLGVQLQPPRAARVEMTFRLSGPQRFNVTIPKGTEVATIRTESQEAISFTTDEDLEVVIPVLDFALTSFDGSDFSDIMPFLNKPEKQIPVFKSVPEVNNAFYLGFSTSLRSQILLLTINANIEGIGVDPTDPPLAWEYWNNAQEKWESLKLEKDSTGGLNIPGNVILHMPSDAGVKEINGQVAFWIRCRATAPKTTQRFYVSSPIIKSIRAECIGGSVITSHCSRYKNEILGRSSGAPGQAFKLNNIPLLSRDAGETIEVESEREGEYQPWNEVKDFSDSGADDPHFTLDAVSGEVTFGPQIREPSGEERQFGRIAPLNRQIRFTSYRSGGGVIGNVGKETITIFKSSVPYITSVINYSAATGGQDAETLEAAMIRAPKLLRNQTRAVTANDFETLAVEASSRVARARCLAAGSSSNSQAIPPGVVRVLVVPRVEDLEGPIPKEQLDLVKSVKTAVQEYLDERRLLAMRVEIAAPEYLQISVDASVRIKPSLDSAKIQAAILKGLYEFVNPVCGGPKGQGWPFGRSLFASDLLSLVQGTEDVEYIEEVKFYSVDWTTGQRQEIKEKLRVPPHGLVCSGVHKVTVNIIEDE